MNLGYLEQANIARKTESPIPVPDIGGLYR